MCVHVRGVCELCVKGQWGGVICACVYNLLGKPVPRCAS